MASKIPSVKPRAQHIIWMSFGPIGDTLLMLAFFEEIMALVPDVRFTVLTSSNTKNIRELSAAYGNIEIRHIPGALGLPAFVAKLLNRASIVIVPGVARTYSLKIKLFFLLLSLRPGNLVLGFREWTGMQGWLPFDHSFSYNFKKSIIENYRQVLPHFIPDVPLHTKSPSVSLRLGRVPMHFPYGPGSYFVVHMFGTRARYSFPPKRWREFLKELHAHFPRFGIVLTGAPKDRKLIEEVSQGLSGIRLCIDEPILTVARLIHDSLVYIGVDTGITHLAAVQSVPSVVIGHNTDPMWLPYYNRHGIVLTNVTRCLCKGDKTGDCVIYEDNQEYRRCTYDVSIHDVIEAIEKKIDAEKKRLDRIRTGSR